MSWERTLTLEGIRWREAAMSGLDADRLLRGTMRRLERDGLTASEALALLGHLLEPLCGRGAAESAVATAARRCGGVSGQNWTLFVGCLSELVGSFCGIAAGRLVDQAGMALEVA
jgi:hypothetical protein